jgi:hypothetical protein
MRAPKVLGVSLHQARTRSSANRPASSRRSARPKDAVHPERIPGGTEEVMAFDLVAGKPEELLLRYGYGACDTVHGVRAYETDQMIPVARHWR